MYGITISARCGPRVPSLRAHRAAARLMYVRSFCKLMQNIGFYFEGCSQDLSVKVCRAFVVDFQICSRIAADLCDAKLSATRL
jgi:hypothetical protein